MIRTVVIGYGYAGERIHVPLIRLAPGLSLHGVVSSSPAKREAITTKLGCRAYEGFDEVLADPAVDLVVLATPNALHAPQAVAALAAGKHVVVDKPMGLRSAEVAQMLQASEHACRILTVFHNRRFDGDYLTIRHLLANGRLGELRRVEFAWQRPGLPRTWKQRASEGGGRLWDLGAHLIDQALQLIPAPVSGVFCRMQRDFPNADVESHAALTILFADGRTAVIDTSSDSYAPKPRYVVVGSAGTFVKDGMDPQEAALAAGDIDAAKEPGVQYGRLHTAEGVAVIPTLAGRWRSFYENLSDVLHRPDPWSARDQLAVAPEQAGRVISIIEAAFSSASVRKAVALNA